MKSASDGFAPGLRRGAQATEKLRKAMQNIPEEVLVYLAESSGFYQTSPASLSHAEVMFREGRRSLFGEVLHFTNAEPAVRKRLQDRAVEEARITSVEGVFSLDME
jgi:hypothetical protein